MKLEVKIESVRSELRRSDTPGWYARVLRQVLTDLILADLRIRAAQMAR